MNKIIPFNKEIVFNDNIGEITSIKVNDDLIFKDDYTITGELIVEGSHKYGDIEEDFSYSLPTTIAVDKKYDTSNSKIMVDNFYYEIINDNTLKVKIDLILENLLFKEEVKEDVIEPIEVDIKEETNTPDKDYSVYRVYVVCEGDTLNKILEKYNITSEELSHYNNIDNIIPGVKLIIPSVDE